MKIDIIKNKLKEHKRKIVVIDLRCKIKISKKQKKNNIGNQNVKKIQKKEADNERELRRGRGKKE